MRTATVNVYKFDELNETAKDVAREWWRNGFEYPWNDEAVNSVSAFVRDVARADISDYRLDTYGISYFDTDATAANFRGLKLRKVNREAMPTGYCLDNTLYYTFFDEFKRTGDAFRAFTDALDAAAREIVADMEYQYSDEVVDEMLTINEYEFTENGKIY